MVTCIIGFVGKIYLFLPGEGAILEGEIKQRGVGQFKELGFAGFINDLL